MKYNRIFTIVIDSVGCGELPDASKFGDKNVNTIKHISESVDNFSLPNMKKLGYGNITDIKGVEKVNNPIGSYGKMNEVSNGKDTMTGHWEIMGLNIQKPFITFTETGFPKELIDELEKKSGRKVIGNYSSSGTEILDELGEEHMREGSIIVYTSADSVLQIAAHEEIISVKELYKICEIAREITMKDEWKVGRIIARPFIGPKKGEFKRTPNRHDYALKPYGKTVLDSLKENKLDMISVGKISDIFDGEGVTEAFKSKSNEDGMNITIDIAKNNNFKGLCFVNLVDFDALYGHRRNPEGYAKCLEEFDKQLGELMGVVKKDDLIIITADHGNDPTAPGSDHTREYVPLLTYTKNNEKGIDLGIRKTFADLGTTIADNFEVEKTNLGESFLNKL